MKSKLIILLSFLVGVGHVNAAERTGPNAANYSPSPRILLAASNRVELEAGAAALGREIDALRVLLKDKADARLLPDVEVYWKAVDWPLRFSEFYRSNEAPVAKTLLKHGLERAQDLRAGRTPWLQSTGLVVRGYRSQIDGSVQPYGLVVPASFQNGMGAKYRLDVWLHGRDNNLAELKFIADREKSVGPFAPTNAIVLHPYGRFCNAFKFAGETDVLEAMEAVLSEYKLDRSRVAIRGFSMGGAGCWHLAGHHPELWAGAAPGAGFAETAEYTGVGKREPKPPWYEQKLWNLYDATAYAANLYNFPVLAYSGELDKQKQAADIMARTMKKEGLELTHLIGPGVEHQYEPKTKQELARRFDELMGRPIPPHPAEIRFTTWTLRYSQCGPFTVDALERHWERADLLAQFPAQGRGFIIQTTNVVGFRLALADDYFPTGAKETFDVDGQRLPLSSTARGNNPLRFRKANGRWELWSEKQDNERGVTLAKTPGRQGPIDDAFMTSFLMVRPTGQPWNDKLGTWVANELTRATNEWRAQFRGEVRVKDDSAVTPSDLAENNLVLWGDPRSNKLLAQIAEQLPLQWNPETVRLGSRTFTASQHVPVLIYPNPLNPQRYVVLNSSFTFSEFREASNAKQTPKLPDFAVLDMTVARNSRPTQGVVAAGFFDEHWSLPADK